MISTLNRFRSRIRYGNPEVWKWIFLITASLFLPIIFIILTSERNIRGLPIEDRISYKFRRSEMVAGKNSSSLVAVVLVICSARPRAISNHLKQLLKYRPSEAAFPIVISQDGNNTMVEREAKMFTSKYNLSYMQHHREKTQDTKVYKYIAQHYKWALNRTFEKFGADYVIITEDDLDISADFFSYFQYAKRVLQNDSSLWCASAWNDNGVPSLVDHKQSSLLWRTDFFPGLGWMLPRTIWNEVKVNFPLQYWDDWFRNDTIRKGRSCLRPELSRTAHNMTMAGKGTSNGLFKEFLSDIKQYGGNFDFSTLPLKFYAKEFYDNMLSSRILKAQETNLQKLRGNLECGGGKELRLRFDGIREFSTLAVALGFMRDIRGGMPRTAYHGIIPIFYGGCRIYIYPKELSLKDIPSFRYNSDWDKMVKFLEFEKVYCKAKPNKPAPYKGICDPYSDEMRKWFSSKGNTRRLEEWGKDMIVI